MGTGEGPEAALRRSISPKIISEAGHFLQNPRCFPPGRKDPPAAPALWHSAEFRPGLQARWASGPKADQLPGHVRSFYLASIFTQASPTISHSPLRPKSTCWGPEAAAELLLPGSEKTFPWPASLQKEETYDVSKRCIFSTTALSTRGARSVLVAGPSRVSQGSSRIPGLHPSDGGPPPA